MNHSNQIKNVSLNPCRANSNEQRAILRKYDEDARAVKRDRTLYDGERVRKLAELRATADAAIHQQRSLMAEQVATYRSWTRYSPHASTTPTEAARRQYFSQRAMAELAHLNPTDALLRIQQVAATGDNEAAQEWVAAARGLVPAAPLLAVERQVEDPDAGAARHFGATVDAIEEQTAWLAWHTDKLLDRAGYVSDAAKQGLEVEEPLDVRVLDLWRDGLEGHASKAFDASRTRETQQRGIAAALPNAGTEGWDASGIAEPVEAEADDAEDGEQ